jgi:hypothetical protein
LRCALRRSEVEVGRDNSDSQADVSVNDGEMLTYGCADPFLCEVEVEKFQAALAEALYVEGESQNFLVLDEERRVAPVWVERTG